MSLVDIKQTWLDPDRTQRAEVKRPLRAGIGLKANGKYTIYSGELRRMPRRWQLLGRAGRGAVHFLALVGRSSAAVSCRPLLYSVKHYILHYSSFTQPEAAAKRRGGLILIHRFLLSLLLFRNHRSLPVPSRGYHLQTHLGFLALSPPPLFTPPFFLLSTPVLEVLMAFVQIV